MENYNYRISTDGNKFRIESAHYSTNPNIESIWTPISQEMDYLSQAQVALKKLQKPEKWRPVTI